ncbi:FAD-dependent monooxygenase [Pseudonocardia nematodicida]|uniref:FAD-dependent monooxygenase n=1 Tax=Pseudonocardia nematodicida TaxID=1206997 RepID=A0ABV1KEB9_9PSEU
MNAQDAPVIVAGAGPVGLLLACELRLGGADVVVLERRARPMTGSRASTLHARTVEFLDGRGLSSALGDPPVEPRGHVGGIPLDLVAPPAPASPYAGQWKVPQATLERILAGRARELGVEVRREHEVVGLTDTGDAVAVAVRGPAGPRRIAGSWLVGCDGADGPVRDLAGIPATGRAATRTLLRADLTGVDIRERRFERHPGGLAVAARLPGGATRVMVHDAGRAPGGRPPDLADVTSAWKRVTGEDLSGAVATWVDGFDDASRQALRYRSGRVLLAGDAAHQRLPVGGQALNLGLADAANLGWKLAAEATGRAPAGLLDSYDAERRPVGRRTLDQIAAQAVLLLGGPEAVPLRALTTELLEIPQVRRLLAGAITGLDTRYELPAPPDGAPPHALAGRRLPPTPVRAGTGPAAATTTAELARDGRGLLLLPPGPYRRALRWAAAAWSGRVSVADVLEGPARGEADPDAPGTWNGTDPLLVRPDGHVAWGGTGPGPVRALSSALALWFGPAAAGRRTAVGAVS